VRKRQNETVIIGRSVARGRFYRQSKGQRPIGELTGKKTTLFDTVSDGSLALAVSFFRVGEKVSDEFHHSRRGSGTESKHALEEDLSFVGRRPAIFPIHIEVIFQLPTQQ
jgi:hypothetical protein